jgi:hypothetical protein
MNDLEVQGFWEARDREAYVDYCLKNVKTLKGVVPTRPVASRWFNLMSISAETVGDLWIHREKNQFWWTTSKARSDLRAPSRARRRQERGGHLPQTPANSSLQKGPSNSWTRTTRFMLRR